MSFTVAVPLPLYAGAAGVTIRVTAPGSPTRVNGGADDAMADTASDGLFTATIAEELVGTYTYLIFRSGTAIQSGWFRRVAGQAAVVLDDERDFRTKAEDVIAETALVGAIVDALPAPLSGPNAITVTVTDSDTDAPIEAASVRFYRSGETGTQTTDDAGETVFGLATATWSWVATASGYSSQTGTLAVSDDGVLAIELDGIVVDQADAPNCNVTLPTIDLTGSPRPDTLVTMKFVKFLAGSTPTAVVVKENVLETSDSNGIASFTLLRLARYEASYKILRGETKVVSFDTPDLGSHTVVEPLT